MVSEENPKFKIAMKLKKLMLFALAIISLAACSKQEDSQQKWEYKVLTLSESLTIQEQADRVAKTISGRVGFEGMIPIQFEDPVVKLNELGSQGWELVSTYTTAETLFPNMGEANYHTGIKENTRTQTINFVFKRIISENENNNQNLKDSEKSVVSENDVLTVEEPGDFIDTATIN